ncbi:MAG TPA: hypothetical protein PLJ60_08860 [Chryseolinea sp.]|nr:hypothetical protein [Chryseolinea sp.]
MKTLTDHTIIYDDECPMCNLYTKAFVKTGMLDANDREAFTEVVNTNIPNINWNRARNEIAVINKSDNSVKYGAEGLVHVIGYNFPMFKSLFNLDFVRVLMSRLYFFISYNRKVIAPGKIFEGDNKCTPDMSYKYRWAYIIFLWSITSTVLAFYSRLLVSLVPESNFVREFLICGGQIIFQGIIVGLVRRDRWIHYLGNVMTVSLSGALLLSPAFLLKGFIHSGIFYMSYFMIVVALMFFEHIRRVKILGLPRFISLTWVIYRFLVLLIIL